MAALAIILTVVFSIVSIMITLLVLIQPPHSEGTAGLAGAFIGAGGDSFFGTKAMSMAGKITLALAIVLVGLAITVNKIGPSKRTGTGLFSGETPPAEAPEK